MTDETTSSRIYVDSTIFIDAFEGSAAHAERLQCIFARLNTGRLQAVTSEFTLAELLGKVSSRGWIWQKRFYLDLLVFNRIFDLRPISRSILIDTGAFRKVAAENGRICKLADAVHAVTAIDSGCQYLFTGDRRFLVPPPIMLLAPDDEGLATIDRALDA